MFSAQNFAARLATREDRWPCWKAGLMLGVSLFRYWKAILKGRWKTASA